MDPIHVDSNIPTRDLVRRYFFELERLGKSPTNAEITRMLKDRAGVSASASTISDELKRLRKKQDDVTVEMLSLPGIPDAFKNQAAEFLSALIKQCQALTDKNTESLISSAQGKVIAIENEMALVYKERDEQRRANELLKYQFEELTKQFNSIKDQLTEALGMNASLNDSLNEQIERGSSLASAIAREKDARAADEVLHRQKLSALEEKHAAEMLSAAAQSALALENERNRAAQYLNDLKTFRTFTAEETSRMRDDIERERQLLIDARKAAEQNLAILEGKNLRLSEEARLTMVEAQKQRVRADVLESQYKQAMEMFSSFAKQNQADPIADKIKASALSAMDQRDLIEIIAEARKERPDEEKTLSKKVGFLIENAVKFPDRVSLLIAALKQKDPDIFQMATKGWE